MSNKKKGVFDSGATHFESPIEYEEAEIALHYGLNLRDELRTRGHGVFITRDDHQDPAPVQERARNAEKAKCEIFVSLHLNDVEDETAHGVEVLYRDKDDKVLADKLLPALVKASGLRRRRVWHRPELAVLKFKGPAALIELGFIANDKDRETLLNPQKRAAIIEAIADVVVGPAPVASPEEDPALAPAASFLHVAEAEPNELELDATPVSKKKFLRNNQDVLSQMIEAVNAQLHQQYDDEVNELTQTDFWVTSYTEMGLKDGKIDPTYVHTEGEHGLLPLPERIHDWSPEAPDPEAPMDLTTNVWHFLVYLGQLKNKIAFYRQLFRYEGIDGDEVKEAITLASAVHGYFYSGAYRPVSKPPTKKIMQGIIDGKRIDKIMAGTKYIHAGDSKLRNRADNIEIALDLLAA